MTLVTDSQAELVAIDEAAAIPLPTVKKLMGPYLVFMSSTGTSPPLPSALRFPLPSPSSCPSFLLIPSLESSQSVPLCVCVERPPHLLVELTYCT